MAKNKNKRHPRKKDHSALALSFPLTSRGLHGASPVGLSGSEARVLFTVRRRAGMAAALWRAHGSPCSAGGCAATPGGTWEDARRAHRRRAEGRVAIPAAHGRMRDKPQAFLLLAPAIEDVLKSAPGWARGGALGRRRSCWARVARPSVACGRDRTFLAVPRILAGQRPEPLRPPLACRVQLAPAQSPRPLAPCAGNCYSVPLSAVQERWLLPCCILLFCIYFLILTQAPVRFCLLFVCDFGSKGAVICKLNNLISCARCVAVNISSSFCPWICCVVLISIYIDCYLKCYHFFSKNC